MVNNIKNINLPVNGEVDPVLSIKVEGSVFGLRNYLLLRKRVMNSISLISLRTHYTVLFQSGVKPSYVASRKSVVLHRLYNMILAAAYSCEHRSIFTHLCRI